MTSWKSDLIIVSFNRGGVIMAFITTYTAVLSIVNFIILWGGIYFLSRWIPPSEGIAAWKSGVMAAVITVAAMLFIGLAMGIISPA